MLTEPDLVISLSRRILVTEGAAEGGAEQYPAAAVGAATQ